MTGIDVRAGERRPIRGRGPRPVPVPPQPSAPAGPTPMRPVGVPWALPPAGMSSRDVTLQVGPSPRWARHRTGLLVLAALAATLVLVAWVTAACLALGAAAASPGTPAPGSISVVTVQQ